MKSTYNLLLNLAVVLATAVPIWIIAQRLQDRDALLESYPTATVADWKKYSEEGHHLGPPNAAVKVVQFIDFQCKYCVRAGSDLNRLRKLHGSNMMLILRHYPSLGDEHSVGAARALECAAAAGHGEQMYNTLIEQFAAIGSKQWGDFAVDAGINDVGKFRSCMDDDRLSLPNVVRDVRLGRTLGITATPTILINDLRLSGYPGSQQLEAYIDKAIRAAM
jgi:protein-disulfide isomerase